MTSLCSQSCSTTPAVLSTTYAVTSAKSRWDSRSIPMPRAIFENGSPKPKFKTDDDHTFFATVLPIHPDAKAAAPDLAGPTGQVTGQVAKVVEHLDGELTRQELQGAVGVASRAHFRTAYLDPALAAGLVEMTQPDKPNSRSQRYRLTATGRKLRLQTPKRKK